MLLCVLPCGGFPFLAKKFRTVKVHLKAGDPLMLYAKQQ